MSILPIIGIPVVEHCNINCKGCLHFCHVGQKPYFYDFETFKGDFQRLKFLFDEINKIIFYGGEPLLHGGLGKFIEFAYGLYPNAGIEIITNGILLPQMGWELREAIKRCNVKINWSVYPVICETKFAEILGFLEENKMEYQYKRIDNFYACLDASGSQDKEEAYKKCSGRNCHVLRNGKISVCPAPLVGQYINQLGANIDFMDGILDIYRVSKSEDVINFLKKPHTACKYCGSPRYFKWEMQSGIADINDWEIENKGDINYKEPH
jgi:organic radical activating enzyme